ncbi:hypothetical protein STP4a_085 [Salmonella phage STP4-a]|uniref:Uncharacterized protein n=2 Tax=Gelderlandvirus TaxID=1913653 RepID=A0A0B4L911_9CAUD|nr:hypothetical protein STP4a_085 [Salmonella phage STP4-a]YP_009286449.1 hypothetical protein BI049_gp083 [Salmonella phage vB_SnwM_CGG4-1]AHJ86940.1 hypothetical protein STP4a_085 [Salmonella phage STP4-a]ANA49437.1 hypothetical protein CGG41_083 [Salmonella phage vB_SnwM_CGG4-1]
MTKDELHRAVIEIIKEEMSIEIKPPEFLDSLFVIQLKIGDIVFAEDYINANDIECALANRG